MHALHAALAKAGDLSWGKKRVGLNQSGGGLDLLTHFRRLMRPTRQIHDGSSQVTSPHRSRCEGWTAFLCSRMLDEGNTHILTGRAEATIPLGTDGDIARHLCSGHCYAVFVSPIVSTPQS